MPIIRRNNCVYATLGTCHSAWMTVWYTGSSIQNNKYQVTHKYSCFSWWWAHSRPKHVEKRNKNTKKNCAPSWHYLLDYTGTHGQQNIKETVTTVVKISAWLNEISTIACTNSSIMWTSSSLVQQTFQAWWLIYKSQGARLSSLMMQHIHQSIMIILHSPLGIFLGFCLFFYKRKNTDRKKKIL